MEIKFKKPSLTTTEIDATEVYMWDFLAFGRKKTDIGTYEDLLKKNPEAAVYVLACYDLPKVQNPFNAIW